MHYGYNFSLFQEIALAAGDHLKAPKHIPELSVVHLCIAVSVVDVVSSLFLITCSDCRSRGLLLIFYMEWQLKCHFWSRSAIHNVTTALVYDVAVLFLN